MAHVHLLPSTLCSQHEPYTIHLICGPSHLLFIYLLLLLLLLIVLRRELSWKSNFCAYDLIIIIIIIIVIIIYIWSFFNQCSWIIQLFVHLSRKIKEKKKETKTEKDQEGKKSFKSSPTVEISNFTLTDNCNPSTIVHRSLLPGGLWKVLHKKT